MSRKDALQQGNHLLGLKRQQTIDAGAREQRRDHLEGRVLRGGADQDDVALLDVGQKGVLLGFVEAVDLVDEQDGAAADAASRARPRPSPL